ncbi:MAG: chemotaxis protein CheD [Bacteriovorax sp.]|nr:chemotaxis protein CheD [Bacteriovorax sp.]
MVSGNEIHVNIGEVKVGKNGDLLKTILGSCVGIAFVWKNKGLFGLAHCLLPEANESTFLIGAKYVSQAVPSLIALLKVRPENIKEIEVFIAGGANMMSQLARQNVDHIGLQNLAAAKKYLELNGFKFREIDVGGEEGRQMLIDCTSGQVSVSRFQKTI